ncbi:hypothetical protein CDAR_89251 [Caerostris darwini]|uniref:Uncharacterized protein n=1 Tax=Caerostris darwini TaxID=1538125 RepID=A0AAV4UHQ4_9ARAC|nr:hypothetical protein CDAR_89251 [Caerostris darwini]
MVYRFHELMTFWKSLLYINTAKHKQHALVAQKLRSAYIPTCPYGPLSVGIAAIPALLVTPSVEHWPWHGSLITPAPLPANSTTHTTYNRVGSPTFPTNSASRASVV